MALIDDYTLSNLQTHYNRSFPKDVTDAQFEISKKHTLSYVNTFLRKAGLELDDDVYDETREAIWDINVYKLWLNYGKPSESIEKLNEEAVKWLKDIAKGVVQIKTENQESLDTDFTFVAVYR